MDKIIDQILPALLPFTQYLGVTLLGSGMTWAGTEGLGTAFPSLPKAKMKFGLGLLAGALLYGSGWLPLPIGFVAEGGQRAFGWGLAIVNSWLAAFGLGVIHDKVIGPWQAKRNGGDK